MQILSEKELIQKIHNKDVFTAQIDTGAFVLKISRYVPVIYTAIHDGHRVHDEFADKMLVSGKERKYEEDPFTGNIIEPFPITLRVLDSRYNYDLNRSPDNCIYEDAWGKKVWKRPLTDEEREYVLDLHAGYYRILDALLDTIERRFLHCVLYDLHSYNYSRIPGDPPLFNIGTHYVDNEKYISVVNHLQEKLAAITIPGIENRAVCDEVFSGKGYQAAFMRENHPKSLCVPLEIKKVFMDEQALGCHADVFDLVSEGMRRGLEDNAEFFSRNFAEVSDN